MRLGAEHARAIQAALQRFSVEPATYLAWAEQRQGIFDNRLAHGGRIGAMRFEGVDPAHSARLARLMDTEAGQALDVQRLEGDLRRLAATGDYEQ
ncbi:hypothetical protein RZS08_02200, partial [Arthrospira platensis SPKY1]|nr:hypothetical protein [Arthrospira platensis SPKY1]